MPPEIFTPIENYTGYAIASGERFVAISSLEKIKPGHGTIYVENGMMTKQLVGNSDNKTEQMLMAPVPVKVYPNPMNLKTMNPIIIYTDGACSGNPGGGGAAYTILVDGKTAATGSKGYRYTTNNRMEIKAVSLALIRLRAMLDNPRIQELKASVSGLYPVIVYSDSQLVVNTFNLDWNQKANIDLWDQLEDKIEALRKEGMKVIFKKVKGHSSDEFNNQADQMAVMASRADEKHKEIDEGYEELQKEKHAVPAERPENEKIVTIELIYCEDGTRRIDVTLTNDTVITIEGYHGGFMQSGGTGTEFRITQPVAERFVIWLNGGKL